MMSKNELSAKDYVMRVRSLTDHLVVIGEAITDRDFIIYTISALDLTYNPLSLLSQ